MAPADVPVLPGVASALSVAPSEAEALVKEASALIDARRRGEISFQKYRKGVVHFQHNHPYFYSGFFGDPVFYTPSQQVLVRQRRISSQEVEPFLESDELERMFLCDGSSWDPFFEQCRGFQFAKSDFLTYPSFLNPFAPERMRTLPPVRLAVFDRSMSSSPASGNEASTEIDRPDDRRPPSTPLAASTQRTQENRSLKERASDNRQTASRSSAEGRRTTHSIESLASQIRPAPRSIDRERDGWTRVTDGLSPEDARIVRQALRHRDRSSDRSIRSERESDRPRARTDRAEDRANGGVVRDRARTHDRSERAPRTVRNHQRDAHSPDRDRQRARPRGDRSPRTERGSREPTRERTQDRSSSRSDSGS